MSIVFDADCGAHALSDALKAALLKVSGKDTTCGRRGDNSLAGVSIEHAMGRLRDHWWDKLSLRGVTKPDPCVSTRFQAYGKAGGVLAVTGTRILAALIPHLNVDINAEDFAEKLGAAAAKHNHDHKLAALLMDPVLRLHMMGLGELHYGVVDPNLKRRHAFMSLQFDKLAQFNLGALEEAAAILADAEGSGFFANSFALAASLGISAASVTRMIEWYVTPYLDYCLNRWEYTTKLPWGFSLLLHPTRAKDAAVALRDEICKVEESGADSDLRRLWASVDKVGFLDGSGESTALRAALEKMAAGEPIPDVLNQRLAVVFGSYCLDASFTEMLVKVGKFVFGENYTDPISVNARYQLFAAIGNWRAQIEAFSSTQH
mmetsp:Transcript_70777/g.198013  ORF Transcript_70777/g.198013 Transcript_70777/m.198013 type:complete len:375 (-) Transcript_70777:3388-4512(-)